MMRPAPGGGTVSLANRRSVMTRCQHEARVRGVGRPGMRRLEPERLSAHLGHLSRAARALCHSREGAGVLGEGPVVRVLARPGLRRGEAELPYLMQALRHTFLT